MKWIKLFEEFDNSHLIEDIKWSLISTFEGSDIDFELKDTVGDSIFIYELKGETEKVSDDMLRVLNAHLSEIDTKLKIRTFLPVNRLPYLLMISKYKSLSLSQYLKLKLDGVTIKHVVREERGELRNFFYLVNGDFVIELDDSSGRARASISWKSFIYEILGHLAINNGYSGDGDTKIERKCEELIIKNFLYPDNHEWYKSNSSYGVFHLSDVVEPTEGYEIVTKEFVQEYFKKYRKKKNNGMFR